MGLPGDDRVTDPHTHREPPARRFGAGDAQVVQFRPRREPLAERLEHERRERERADRERRARIDRARAARERELQERLERRRQARLDALRRERERETLRRRRGRRRRAERARRVQPSAADRPVERAQPVPPTAPAPAPSAPRAQVRPGVEGPVRKRTRAAENRRRAAARRTGLFWPTAKAGFAVTLVLGLSAGLGALLGLPVPGPTARQGREALASATLFGVDPGTPAGLSRGFVFPIIGAHDFGDAIARFGAPRPGHIHEGQDIFAKSGRPEVAVHDGIVVDRGKSTDADSGGRGNFIVIYSPAENHSFVYMHMLKPSPVQLGQRVHAGETVGQVGCTGECDGPHLHFEVRIGKATPGAETKPIDPLPFLRQWPQTTPG